MRLMIDSRSHVSGTRVELVHTPVMYPGQAYVGYLLVVPLVVVYAAPADATIARPQIAHSTSPLSG